MKQRFALRPVVAASLALASFAVSANPRPPYWQYVSPFDGSSAQGTWGDVESFSESNVNSHLGAGYACIWASGEPAAQNPGTYYGDWGGTTPDGTPCTGRFAVSWVACGPNETWRDEANACVPVSEQNPPQTDGSCPRMGDPISPLNGANSQSQPVGNWLGLPEALVYDTAMKVPSNDSTLSFQGQAAPSFGPMWQDSLHRRLWFQSVGTPQGAIQASRGSWKWVSFHNDGTGTYVPSSDVADRLSQTSTGWIYYDQTNDAEEVYDSNGVLQRLAGNTGHALTFTYNTAPSSDAPAVGLLTAVADQFGRSIRFTYEASELGLPPHVASIVDPGNNATSFDYDLLTDNLEFVTWPGDTDELSFVYESPNLRWALTGVIDENGKRTATFGYDAAGRGNDTQQAGGVNHIHVDYAAPPSWQVTDTYDSANVRVLRTRAWVIPQGTVVTLPNGQTSSLSAVSVANSPRLSSQSQSAGSGCAASTRSAAYDSNSNPTQRDDFDGHRACYAYDTSRNLETTRIEGLSTSASCTSVLPSGSVLPANSRKVSTQWHPDWRLAIKVAEPGKMTTNVYNGQPDPFNGGATANCAPNTALLPDNKPIVVLCKKVEQATTDTDGSQGFSATLDTKVPNRVWTYSYNQYGQVLTAKGPRTDVSDTTTYAYYSDTTSSHMMGDLQTVTDPLGHATNYTQYDAYGNVLEQVDVNQVVADYTYDLRQGLKTVKVGNQTTSYAYWPTGLLKQVTFPDLSYVAYSYDDAHRLTDVSDFSGNSVHYVLDNAGNRLNEQYKDPQGSLKRELDRAYDALGRVQQTTGRQ